MRKGGWERRLSHAEFIGSTLHDFSVLGESEREGEGKIQE